MDDDFYYDDDYVPPETKKEKRERKKREKKNRIIAEVIDTLRDETNVRGTCHGCPNVYKDAANFLVWFYKPGIRRVEHGGITCDHELTTVITFSASLPPYASTLSIAVDDDHAETVQVMQMSKDGRQATVLRR